MQKNEGGWEFSLEESVDGRAIELDVAIGRFLDSSLVKADVQPRTVRLLIKAGAQPCLLGGAVLNMQSRACGTGKVYWR
jgi:protein TilB